ncbi:MAG: hypothetical protein RLZ55_661 [Actinomycetota bacterium]
MNSVNIIRDAAFGRDLPVRVLFGAPIAEAPSYLLHGVGEAASRRDVLDPRAADARRHGGPGRGLLPALAAVAPAHPAMLAMMALIGAVWTLALAAIGGRWVEVGPAAPGSFVQAGPALSAVTLTWDVVFEIAAVYLPVLAIPVMLGLIGDPAPLPVATSTAQADGGGSTAPAMAAR